MAGAKRRSATRIMRRSAPTSVTAIRRFMAFSETQAGGVGLTPQQHQALLAIRAAPGGMATIGFVAERLVLKPHSATGLVDRLEALGLADPRNVGRGSPPCRPHPDRQGRGHPLASSPSPTATRSSGSGRCCSRCSTASAQSQPIERTPARRRLAGNYIVMRYVMRRDRRQRASDPNCRAALRLCRPMAAATG